MTELIFEVQKIQRGRAADSFRKTNLLAVRHLGEVEVRFVAMSLLRLIVDLDDEVSGSCAWRKMFRILGKGHVGEEGKRVHVNGNLVG